MNNIKLAICVLIIGTIACKSPEKKQVSSPNWKYEKTISLDSIGPVGIALDSDENLYVSDADNNRIFKINQDGKVLESFENFDRPMHISWGDQGLAIAEYGSDQIVVLHQGKKDTANSKFEFDAISGVDAYEGGYYAADFYNHRITCQTEDSIFTVGKQGKAAGEFTYPTDIQIFNQKIYVADAYNHRVQIFDLNGNHKSTLAENEKINAATGLFVTNQNIFITDFENSRILVYNSMDSLSQILTEGLDKPANVIVVGTKLFAVNYHGRSIAKYNFN